MRVDHRRTHEKCATFLLNEYRTNSNFQLKPSENSTNPNLTFLGEMAEDDEKGYRWETEYEKTW